MSNMQEGEENVLHGSLDYHDIYNQWHIKCEPAAALVFRRVFRKTKRHDSGFFILSDTLEHAFDLSWFITRFPLAIDRKVRTHLDKRTNEWREQARLIDRLLSGHADPMPGDLAHPLREYQCIAVQMAWALGGLLVADAGGLGKTVECIGLTIDPRTLPLVVVTLSDLPPQWRDEFNYFAPDLEVHIAKGVTPYDLTGMKLRSGARQQVLGTRFPDVVILNYEKLSGWADYLAHYARAVAWDEVQELRTGPGTLKYDAACHLADAVDFRVGYSATPIYNYGGEFYNIFRCIRPDALGTREEFLMEWCKGNTGRRVLIANTSAFRDHLLTSGLMIQRSRKDVKRELPGNGEPLVIPHVIGSDQAAYNEVVRSCEDLAKIIMANSEAFKGQKMQAARSFNTKLRQATGIAKAPYVADFLRLLVESGDCPVVFGWHREFWDILMTRLADLRPVMWTGTESPRQKEDSKARFLDRESPLFFCSLRAGAGIDGLQQRSSVAVIAELDFSPERHKQNILRVYRDGQEDIVRAYFLIAETGSDPAVAEILNIKALQIGGIMDFETPALEEQINPEHMKHLAAKFLDQLANTRRADRGNGGQVQLGIA